MVPNQGGHILFFLICPRGASNEYYNIWSTSWQKPTKWHVRSTKTQISLGIHPIWSESSLCTQWVAKDLSFLHADSEDSDQPERMLRLIWVFAGRTCYFIGFVLRQHMFWWKNKKISVFLGVLKKMPYREMWGNHPDMKIFTAPLNLIWSGQLSKENTDSIWEQILSLQSSFTYSVGVGWVGEGGNGCRDKLFVVAFFKHLNIIKYHKVVYVLKLTGRLASKCFHCPVLINSPLKIFGNSHTKIM